MWRSLASRNQCWPLTRDGLDLSTTRRGWSGTWHASPFFVSSANWPLDHSRHWGSASRIDCLRFARGTSLSRCDRSETCRRVFSQRWPRGERSTTPPGTQSFPVATGMNAWSYQRRVCILATDTGIAGACSAMNSPCSMWSGCLLCVWTRTHRNLCSDNSPIFGGRPRAKPYLRSRQSVNQNR